MKKVYSLDCVKDMFSMLADNEYSLAWELIEDFEINGHIVSIKDSTQFKSVIIDGRYVRIGGNTTIQVNGTGKIYEPLEYAMMLLEKEQVTPSHNVHRGRSGR